MLVCRYISYTSYIASNPIHPLDTFVIVQNPSERRTWVAFHLHHPLEISQVDEGCEPPQHPRDEMEHQSNSCYVVLYDLCVWNVSEMCLQCFWYLLPIKKKTYQSAPLQILQAHIKNITTIYISLSWREYGEIKLQQKYHHHSLQASPWSVARCFRGLAHGQPRP